MVKFKNSYIQKLYENCINNMTGTSGDWEKVVDTFIDISNKRPELTGDLLKIINILEMEFAHEKAS